MIIIIILFAKLIPLFSCIRQYSPHMWRTCACISDICRGTNAQWQYANRIENTSVEFVHFIGEAIEKVYMHMRHTYCKWIKWVCVTVFIKYIIMKRFLYDTHGQLRSTNKHSTRNNNSSMKSSGKCQVLQSTHLTRTMARECQVTNVQIRKPKQLWKCK